MKNLFTKLALAITLAVLFIGCQQYPQQAYYAQQPMQYQPGAQLGYQGSTYGAYVTDDRGEQFFMDYVLFSALMNQGGYNRVISTYYSQPSNTHIHVYNGGSFRRSGTPDAIRYSQQFNQSYTTVYNSHSAYRPDAKTITRDVKWRTKEYGSTYRPSSATPVVRNSSFTNSRTTTTAASTVTSPSVSRPSSFQRSSSSISTSSSVNLSKPAYRPSAPVSRPSSFSSPSRSYSSSSRSSSVSRSSSFSRHR